MNDKAEAEQKLLSTSAITFFRQLSQKIVDFIQLKQTSGDLFVPNRKSRQIKINFAMANDHQLDVFKSGSAELLTCFLLLVE